MMRPRLSILIHRRVLARPGPLLPSLPDVRRFDRQMALLQRWIRAVPLRQAVRRLQVQLPRFTPSERDRPLFLLRLLESRLRAA
jgi:hypothetical protein